jgi:hypothetical protein
LFSNAASSVETTQRQMKNWKQFGGGSSILIELPFRDGAGGASKTIKTSTIGITDEIRTQNFTKTSLHHYHNANPMGVNDNRPPLWSSGQSSWL